MGVLLLGVRRRAWGDLHVRGRHVAVRLVPVLAARAVCPRVDERAEEAAVQRWRVQRADGDPVERGGDVCDDCDGLLLVVEERLELGSDEL